MCGRGRRRPLLAVGGDGRHRPEWRRRHNRLCAGRLPGPEPLWGRSHGEGHLRRGGRAPGLRATRRRVERRGAGVRARAGRTRRQRQRNDRHPASPDPGRVRRSSAGRTYLQPAGRLRRIGVARVRGRQGGPLREGRRADITCRAGRQAQGIPIHGARWLRAGLEWLRGAFRPRRPCGARVLRPRPGPARRLGGWHCHARTRAHARSPSRRHRPHPLQAQLSQCDELHVAAAARVSMSPPPSARSSTAIRGYSTTRVGRSTSWTRLSWTRWRAWAGPSSGSYPPDRNGLVRSWVGAVRESSRRRGPWTGTRTASSVGPRCSGT